MPDDPVAAPTDASAATDATPPESLDDPFAPPVADANKAPPAADADASATPAKGDDGKAPGADKGDAPPIPWAQIADPTELLSHEALKPHLEEREAAARKAGASDAQARIQPLWERQAASLQSLDGKMETFVESWNELLEGAGDTGKIEAKDVAKLFKEHGSAIETLAGVQQGYGRWSGYQQMVEELGRVLDNKEFAKEYKDRLWNMQRGLEATDEEGVKSFFSDLTGALTDAATKPLRTQLAEAKAKIDRLESEAKAAGRNGQPGPADVSGRGAAKGGRITEVTDDNIWDAARQEIARLKSPAQR